MANDDPCKEPEVEVQLPACYSIEIVVDRNRARQLLVSSQRGLVEGSKEKTLAKLADGTSYRLLRRRSALLDNELAVFLPRKVTLENGTNLAEIAGVVWFGGRAPLNPEAVLRSLPGSLAFIEEDLEGGKGGLRTPQLGAVHAVLGYWTTDPTDPGTVVMPTGTGKTETMVGLFASGRIERLLVLVPSDVLRAQLASKFESFGVLKQLGVIAAGAPTPVVGQIKHAFSSAQAAEDFVEKCNIVVTTPQAIISSPSEIRSLIVNSFTHLFVDEAHHVAAETWSTIRDAFAEKIVVQFTATPFREDGRRLGGRLIYAFPLREAQRQGYFSRINYASVVEFEEPDRAIATRAVEQLRRDLEAGKDHILMARVKRIGRADEILPIYAELASDLSPRILHSSQPARMRQEAIEAIRSRESRIIVCVDMLGEGFDLPALKIAAVHDPHKTLGVTLQFVGRFARSGMTGIGEATVVVGRPDPTYDDKLRRLYAEDADWNKLIRDVSDSAVGEQVEVTEFEAGFGTLPEEVSIRSLLPKMSTVVYRTPDGDWNPDRILELYPEDRLLTLPIAVNASEHVAWFVTKNVTPVDWGDIKTVEEVVFDLYVVYWDSERRLLYINSSDNTSVHQELAEAVCGEGTERIRGEKVYRVMANIDRLVPTNVGVLDVRSRARRFSMHVGADVSEGFPVAEAQTKTKTNIFAYGFEDGKRVSVGGSLKGRVWSYRVAPSLKHWMDWCDDVGGKLTDDSVSVDEVMRHFIRPKEVRERPELVVLGLEWPWELFLSTSEEVRIEYGGKSWPIIDVELQVPSFDSTGPVRFKVTTPDWALDYEARFGATKIDFIPLGDDARVTVRETVESLSAFLGKKGLTFHLEREAMIVPPGILLQVDRTLPPFDQARLHTLDWDGVNIRKESQGPRRDADSVQARALTQLQTVAEWDVVIDDDTSGEIADLVALRLDNKDLYVYLLHCKFSSEDLPGARIIDLYAVCGQAQKSTSWRRSVDHMLRQLIRRERSRKERFGRNGIIKGSAKKLLELQEQARLARPHFTIGIAQPGLSKAQASNQQLELLAATEVYLRETALAEFDVYCSI
jgi:superfamily II DNA or RNA helicase